MIVPHMVMVAMVNMVDVMDMEDMVDMEDIMVVKKIVGHQKNGKLKKLGEKKKRKCGCLLCATYEKRALACSHNEKF